MKKHSKSIPIKKLPWGVVDGIVIYVLRSTIKMIKKRELTYDEDDVEYGEIYRAAKKMLKWYGG